MSIDRFLVWLVFSGVLALFLVVSFFYKILVWVRYKQELSHIKKNNIHQLVQSSQRTIQQSSGVQESQRDYYDLQLLELKKEIDGLMKDIYFDVYDKTDTHVSRADFRFDFEQNIEHLLDSKILDIVKEKDGLLYQKDAIISGLQKKNSKLIKEIIHKMFYVLVEKDKLLRQKDELILQLTQKIQEEKTVVASTSPTTISGFVNVNAL